MRGDELRRPVEWHLFTGVTNSKYRVVYVNHGGTFETCGLDGCFAASSTPCDKDLIPIPSPPRIVPWESLREIPVGIWIRYRDTNVARQIVEYDYEANYVRMIGACESLPSLFHNCEWNVDPHADDGWQPCGKVVQS